jgi:MYXO-CTERM domain-containing protein
MRALWLLLAACTAPGSTSQALSAATRHDRLTTIRDISAQMGVYNAALLGGIAVSETGLCHCWSEATWACQGPASPSCSDGPVIAGAADGPCADMQGGLGMFQFDAGTYDQTLAMYGSDILTVEGNTAQAVAFVVAKVNQDIAGAGDWMSATGWMNSVPLRAGDPVTEQWAHLLACRYNGCCSTSATCTQRANGYRDNAIDVYNEMGAEFWNTSSRCAALPADGVIDQRSDCYVAAGEPRFWRREASGYAGNLEWTLTTNAAAPANFAHWLIRIGHPGHYHVEVNLDGGTFGQSHEAAYQIVHAGVTDTVVVDQTSASDFVPLGDFDFSGDGDEYVMLADNTGEPSSMQTKLLFDAIRVTSLDGDAPGNAGCGCAGGGGAIGGMLVLVVIGVRRRRR